MHLFIRNNPDIIADAKEFTYEAFLSKYRQVITEKELSEVYAHIRLEMGLHKAPVGVALPAGKRITFKVAQINKRYDSLKPEMKVVKGEEDKQPGET